MSVGRVANPSESTFIYRNQVKSLSPSPLKEATAVDYRSDGSGRDSYIIQNSGGLKNNFRHTGEKFFKDSLRQNEYIPYKRVKPVWDTDITDYLNWRAPRVTQKIR